MDEPEEMNAEVAAGRVVDFPMRTFIDEGLLHHFNSRHFWPLGIMLTAEHYQHDRERYRSHLVPMIRRALDSVDVRELLLDAAARGGMLRSDPLATAIFENMESEGAAVDTLRLRQYDPPERVVSGLSVDMQRVRQVAAARWIDERTRTIKP